MKRSTMFIILAVVAVIAIGGGLFAVTQKNNKPASNAAGAAKDHETMQTTAPTTQATPPAASSSQSNAVSIKGYAFGPAAITIKKGTTVTWTNEDPVKHDITSSDAGGPKSELLPKGGTYSFTFDTVGTFNYHCTPHPYMKAMVTVTE